MTGSRRSFLKQWVAAPAVALSSRGRMAGAATEPGRRRTDSSFDPFVHR